VQKKKKQVPPEGEGEKFRKAHITEKKRQNPKRESKIDYRRKSNSEGG